MVFIANSGKKEQTHISGHEQSEDMRAHTGSLQTTDHVGNIFCFQNEGQMDDGERIRVSTV